VIAARDPRRKRRDYSKPHRLFVEDTPVEVRAILEEAAAVHAVPSAAGRAAARDAGMNEDRGAAATELPPDVTLREQSGKPAGTPRTA
jgi:hypothetical protein